MTPQKKPLGTAAQDISLGAMLAANPAPAPSPVYQFMIAHYPLANPKFGLDNLPQHLAEYSAAGWEHYDTIAGQSQSAIVTGMGQGPEPLLMMFLRRPAQAKQDIPPPQITPMIGG